MFKFPSYVDLYRSGVLKERVEKALSMLEECRVCPHNCGVNRLKDEKGKCKTGRYAIVSSFFPHLGEEFPIRGFNGSGTIFFSYCNMKCVYCQNYTISQFGEGEEKSPEELAHIMLYLQEAGCHNINLVTPSHVVPQILEALLIAVEKGLKIPIVYNTSSYDSIETLKLLEGIVDIYLADFKYWKEKEGKTYSKVKDYPSVAKDAIKEMYRQVGDLKTDERGIAYKGLLIRHLILPDMGESTEKILDCVKDLSPNTAVNIMDQYRPFYKAYKYKEINRRIRYDEYQRAILTAKKKGLTLIS